MKIVLIGDNRDRLNWGCRATSAALIDILNRDHEISYCSKGFMSLDDKYFFWGYVLRGKLLRAIMFLSKISAFSILMRIIGIRDYINRDVVKSLNRLIRIARKNKEYGALLESIEKSDALVINGEGSFIFSNPYRRDTIFYLALLKYGQQLEKKTYIVNTMLSDCPRTGRNEKVLSQFLKVASDCSSIVLRDRISFRYLKEKYEKDNVVEAVDALYYWKNKVPSMIGIAKEYPFSLFGFPEEVITESKSLFNKPYLVISGSSSAAWNPQDAVTKYCNLVNKLKSLDKEIYLVPTCAGDKFLHEVGKKCGINVIPPNVNIYIGLSILANACCFISGRWHPTILATIAGTPSVVLSSNSHKSKALIEWLPYSKQSLLPSLPSNDDINEIYEKASEYILNEKGIREITKTFINKMYKKSIVNGKL